jgi:methyl-accepting chemotaxis protein
MAKSVSEQSLGIDHAGSNMKSIEDIAGQNAALVEEATAASHSLADQADGLRQLVQQFRLDSSVVADVDFDVAPSIQPAPASRKSKPAPKVVGGESVSDYDTF